MKASPTIETPLPRTWRDIPQPITPRAMSREGRRRRVLAAVKAVSVAAAVIGAGWGGAEGFSIWRKNPGALVTPADSAPLRSLIVRSDGVLGEEWAHEALALPAKARLMALDLEALRGRLLASGQVRQAELARQLPDRLVITLRERAPVARVNARAAGDDAPRALLVARDGTVFAGVGFTAEALARLPFLDGVRLTRVGAGFAPIDGMDKVANLLDAARSSSPALARNFEVISLARLAADDAILVRSGDVGEMVFDARGGFARQIARLELSVATARRRFPDGPLRVDLAVRGDQVLVARLAVAVSSSIGGAGKLSLPSLAPAETTRPGAASALSLPPPPAFPISHAL